jgi:hypothetical protein
MAYLIKPMIYRRRDYIKVGDDLVGFARERYYGDPEGDKPPSSGGQGYTHTNAVRPMRSGRLFGKGLMPDFFEINSCDYFVSSYFKDLIEALAPGAMRFTEVAIVLDPKKNPAPAYYVINVLVRVSRFNWALTPHRDRSGNRFADDGKMSEWSLFPADDSSPLVWLEDVANGDNEVVAADGIFVSDKIGEALLMRFPSQIEAMHIAERAA